MTNKNFNVIKVTLITGLLFVSCNSAGVAHQITSEADGYIRVTIPGDSISVIDIQPENHKRWRFNGAVDNASTGSYFFAATTNNYYDLPFSGPVPAIFIDFSMREKGYTKEGLQENFEKERIEYLELYDVDLKIQSSHTIEAFHRLTHVRESVVKIWNEEGKIDAEHFMEIHTANTDGKYTGIFAFGLRALAPDKLVRMQLAYIEQDDEIINFLAPDYLEQRENQWYWKSYDHQTLLWNVLVDGKAEGIPEELIYLYSSWKQIIDSLEIDP
ncbi:hypothetical protein [Spirochaeta dissipatitropha]